MNRHQLGITALGIAVTMAGAGIMAAHLLSDDQPRAAAESTASASADEVPAVTADVVPPGDPGVPGVPGDPGVPAQGKDVTALPAPTPQPATEADPGTGPGTSDDAAPRTSTEVLPAEPEVVALPPSQPVSALVSPPYPASASSLGQVVTGFPSDVLPGIPDSLIDSSSVATEDQRMQATLVARTTLPADEVLTFYRQHFAPLGLLESPISAAGRSQTVSFARGDESVTVAITGVTDGSTYIVFGTFAAEG
jgi:hypothetical protein